MFDQAALCALATVIREGSFERAAQALCVTPSAVSQRIRALEERVGCAPMVRRQPCQATDTGRRSCQHVDRGRWLEQELRGTLPSLALDGAVRVTLLIAVKADGLATWFAPAVAAIAADASVLVELTVDDQDHTAEWLRRGVVLAAVTDTARPPAGFDSRPLGVMRYRAARYFSRGAVAAGLERAPSLVFNAQDELQARWVQRPCQRDVPLPRHTWPSAHAFLAAALASMGQGLHAQALIADRCQAEASMSQATTARQTPMPRDGPGPTRTPQPARAGPARVSPRAGA